MKVVTPEINQNALIAKVSTHKKNVKLNQNKQERKQRITNKQISAYKVLNVLYLFE